MVGHQFSKDFTIYVEICICTDLYFYFNCFIVYYELNE